MVAAAVVSKAPTSIEDFLWNVHTVLVSAPPTLPLDQLTEVYFKHLGHKCNVKNFLVVGEGGLAATLKRIPHVVTLYESGGIQMVKATQVAEATRQDLIDADQAYRRDLVKKNALAKAAGAKAKPKAAPAPVVAPAVSEAAGSPEKRPAEGSPPGANGSKVAKTGDDSETLGRMLVQGVVRVLQNRVKGGKGALPIGDLEEEFKLLWKVPFNLQQAQETDALTFLQKWPNKVTVTVESGVNMVALAKKNADGSPKVASPAAAQAAPPKAGVPAAKSSPPAVDSGAVAKAGAVAATTDAASPPIAQRPGGPTRPPASIEDFLFNMHSTMEAYGGPLPIDQLKDAYSKHLGHKCAIERFLVVPPGSGMQGLASTLSRIPHVITVDKAADGSPVLKATQPAGTNREQLVQADQNYRKQLQQKNQAAKAAAKQPAVGSDATPPSAASTPATAPARPPPAKAASPTATPPAAVAEKRPAPDAAGGDAKRPRTGEEDRETLGKMLIQGVVRVLQTRAKEGKGPLPIASLEEEFKATWKVPFNLSQAGENDTATFLRKWPNKVDVGDDANRMVQLAKKGAGKASAPAPAVTPAAPAAAVSAPVPATVPATSTAVATAPRAAGNGVAATPVAAPQNLTDAKRQASEILQEMKEMLRKQEAFVSALGQLSNGAVAPS